jgi:hypothetical protein
LVALLAALSPSLAGCGTDPALLQARSTLASATRVVTELDTRAAAGPTAFGPEVPARLAEPAHATRWEALCAAVAAASQRVEEASVALDLWEAGDSGDLAWRTVLPCVAQELAEVRAHLEALGVPASVALDEALALTASTGERCGSRRPPAER